VGKLNYCSVGTKQAKAAKEFYDALFQFIGGTALADHQSGGRAYIVEGTMCDGFGPSDGQPATVGKGSMVGFSFDTRAEVAGFYNKALGLGGTDAGPPGERERARTLHIFVISMETSCAATSRMGRPEGPRLWHRRCALSEIVSPVRPEWLRGEGSGV
jgi:hypothetical protein